MPKKISEIKESANQLARRAKLGQVDTKTLVAVVNDLVNYLAAIPESTPKPAPVVSPDTNEEVSEGQRILSEALADVEAADEQKPKRRRRTKAKTVAAVGAPAESDKPGTQRTLPLTAKVGRGVTVGTPGTVNTGVTVGSAPHNPVDMVTVGGRPRKV